MRLIQLNYFISVAETLNFTQSSQSLFVSQPTISKQILLLEEELGVKLLSRSTKQVTLTPAGTIFYNETKEALGKLRTAVARTKDAGREEKVELRIGLNEFFDMQKVFPGFIKQFAESHPNVYLSVGNHSINSLRKMLLDGDLDLIVLQSFELQDNSEVDRIMLTRANHRLYYSKSLLIAQKNNLSFKDFLGEALISLPPEESSVSLNLTKQLCLKHGLPFQKIVTVDNFETMLLHVESGLGVSILGGSSRLTANDKIAYYEIKDPEFLVGADAVWLCGNSNPILQQFVSQLPSTIYY